MMVAALLIGSVTAASVAYVYTLTPVEDEKDKDKLIEVRMEAVSGWLPTDAYSNYNIQETIILIVNSTNLCDVYFTVWINETDDEHYTESPEDKINAFMQCGTNRTDTKLKYTPAKFYFYFNHTQTDTFQLNITAKCTPEMYSGFVLLNTEKGISYYIETLCRYYK